MKILVTGGTGFIGPKIVHALREHGRDVRVLVRRPERAARVAGLGAELVSGDITDPASLQAAVDGCTHIVHLVAIIRGKPADYDRVMTQGTRNLVAAAKAARLEGRFVLMGALGATAQTAAVAPYFAAKHAMEQEVASSGLEYTTFRPSFVFGPGGMLPTFVSQVRMSPVVTVIGSGQQRLQPIWVDDVAAYFARGVDAPAAANRVFEIGGPDAVTWNELYLTIAKVLGKRRRLLHIPTSVARTGAQLTQWAPGAPVTTDQIAMIEAGDNVVSGTDAVDTFQLPLVPLQEQIRRAA